VEAPYGFLSRNELEVQLAWNAELGDIPPPTEIPYSHVNAHIVATLSPANTREVEVV